MCSALDLTWRSQYVAALAQTDNAFIRVCQRLWLLPVLGLYFHAQLTLSAPATPDRELGVATFDSAWQIIRDSYFDPKLNGLDWDAVRDELRPKAQAAKTTPELRAVLQEMLQRLEASHMALIPGDVARSIQQPADAGRPRGDSAPAANPEAVSSNPGESGNKGVRQDGEPGFQIRLSDGRVLVTQVDPAGPAARVGVAPGWILRMADGVSMSELLRALPSDLEPHRVQFMGWALVMAKLLGAPGSTIDAEFLDGADEKVARKILRRHVVGAPSKLGYLPTFYSRFESERRELPGGGTVGLIRFNLWMVPIVQALDRKVDEFRQADGMIIDLRGNVGGLGGMILGVSGHFLADRVSLGTLTMRDNELKFFANPRRVSAAGERVEPYAGPLAILVDGISLSAAEIFAAGMRAVGRARLFGERSGGQALPAVWDRLPNGDVLYHAFGDFVTASGERVEGKGVDPDEVVRVRREDLLAGRDAVQEAAMKWIAQEKAHRVPETSIKH